MAIFHILALEKNEIIKKTFIFIAGILGGVCGDYAIRLRPALIFEPKHANIYLDKLRKTLREL